MSIRIAAIGLSHNHIYGQVDSLIAAGAELVWFYGTEPENVAQFAQTYPQVRQARSIEEILDDKTIQMVVSATVPSERAPLGIRVMRSRKDFMSDKPGFTSFEQLEETRRVQAETGRIYSICFSERLGNPATAKASELVRAGAIGRVVQTVGFGPHRLLGHVKRPDWTFDPQYFGGIINDLASHQVDQFLHFTGSTSAEVVASQVGNFNYPQYPLIQDFGDLILRSDTATGYIRVDWLTPVGMPVWGDVRLFLLGTQGTIEVRKNVDVEGKAGDNHLFLVDGKGTQYIDCRDTPLPYGAQLIDDVLNRTETAMSQVHVFLASELALRAQAQAQRIGSGNG